MSRQPNGQSSINQRADGWFHTDVHIGHYPNGRPKSKHIKRKTATEVANARDDLLELMKRGADPQAKLETYGEWATHWVHVILKRQLRAKQIKRFTWDDYESITRVHLIPGLGEWRITGRKRRLESSHVEELWALKTEAGLAGSYIKRMHVVLNQQLKAAFRAGRADRVVTGLMDPPEFKARKVPPLTRQHAIAVLAVAMEDELAARWVIGMLHGPRQGEVLGMRWPMVVLDPDEGDVPHVQLDKQLQRWDWQHGCPDPVICNRDRHLRLRPDGRPYVRQCRDRPCPPKYRHGCGPATVTKTDSGETRVYPCARQLAHHCPDKAAEMVEYERRQRQACARHTRLEYCRPCLPACDRHASTCPDRINGGLVDEDPKTDESKAPMALVGIVVDLLRTHREKQIAAVKPGKKWDENGYVFVNEQGRPINPRDDWGRWSALLDRAQVPHYRLHSARHTSGTFLRATGSDLKMIQDVLRQTQMKTTGGYIEVGLAAQREAVERVAAALMQGDLSMIMGGRSGVIPSVAIRPHA